MTPAPRSRFNPWLWLPVLVIALTAIPNIILVVVAQRARISKVEDHPWLAAERLDEQARLQAAFRAAGAAFSASASGRTVRAVIDGPLPAQARMPLHLLGYRSSDAALDRTAPWPDARHPCLLELPAGGRWVLQLTTADGLTMATYAVDLSA